MASAESSYPQISPSPSDTSEATLTPTTDAVPSSRILLVGRSGAGKSSLVNSVFKTPDLAKVEHNRAGKSDINNEITSPHNPNIILHDSEGYEPGDDHKFNTVQNFIAEQTKKNVDKRIHAIWLCIPVPSDNARIEMGDQEILKLISYKVPIIVVFTKYDELFDRAAYDLKSTRGDNESKDSFQKKCREKAWNDYEAKCIPQIPKEMSFIHVSTKMPETLEKLVETTIEQIKALDPPERLVPATDDAQHAGSPARKSLTKKLKGLLPGSHRNVQHSKPDTGLSDSTRAGAAFATAQRIDMPSKINASIEIGKNHYWRGIASGMSFTNRTLKTCTDVIHTDIIRIWNIPDLNEFFSSDGFRDQVVLVIGDLCPDTDGSFSALKKAAATAVGAVGVAAAASGPAAPIAVPATAVGVFLATWAILTYRKSRDDIRCLMGYVVDLTLIMKAVFHESLNEKDSKVTQERVNDIVDKFNKWGKKTEVHRVIASFSSNANVFAKDAVVDKIEHLITSHNFSS